MMSELSAVAKRKNMATIRSRKGILYLDYRLNSKRIQRSTGLQDTKENRIKLEKEVIPALEKRVFLGDFSKPDSKKFSHYFNKYIDLHKEDKSFKSRKYVYDKVNAFFGNYEITGIKRLTVKEYLNNLPYKSSSKKDYVKCLKGVFDIAIDDEVITTNHAVGIKLKADEKEAVQIFTPSEIEAMLSNADEMFKNYIGIALYTGMRNGEILGLMHSDIQDDRICIRRSISKGRITSPKTVGSVRDVPIFEAVRPFLESQKKISNSLYLFDYKNVFISDANFFRARWATLVKKCDMEYRKLYSTRHTFITAMLNSGKFKIMEIAAIVGHTSPEMIMKNYTGFIKSEHLKIDTNIELFKNSGDKIVTVGDNMVTLRKMQEYKRAITA
jgi:integrase